MLPVWKSAYDKFSALGSANLTRVNNDHVHAQVFLLEPGAVGGVVDWGSHMSESTTVPDWEGAVVCGGLVANEVCKCKLA